MRFMLGNITIKYICDTQHLNFICLISYFDMLPFFWALFPLKHICYYFNKRTPYRWTLTLSIVYKFKINLSFLRPPNRNYSQSLFDYIAYSSNNTGRHCVVFIYQYKGKYNALIFIPLLFS